MPNKLPNKLPNKPSNTKTTRSSAANASSSAKTTARAARHLEEVRKLTDLTTLKTPRREHEANFELFDARKALRDTTRLPWTNKEVARLLFVKRLVQEGTFSDFPGLTQRTGADITQGLLEWRHSQRSMTN